LNDAKERFSLPLYEYKCVKCGHRFEKIESLSAPTTRKCLKCGKKAERQLAAPAIQFKGSGWYVTDYGGKGSSSSESAGDGSAAKAATAGESKASESKSPESTESKPGASDTSNKGASKRKK
jgi:putative FmdB family regulatory protein